MEVIKDCEIINYRPNPPETPETPLESFNTGDSIFNPSVIQDSMINESDKMEVEITEPSGSFTVDYFSNKSVYELSRYSWTGSQSNQKFLKGCLWSPDGTCILSAVNGDGMHVVELPRDLYSATVPSGDRPVDILESAVHVKEAGIIYDFCWYPLMNSGYPNTCGWIASRQHEPIQMWDAFTSELRCSYRGYNAVDEVESALSVMFSSDGEQVIGGYKKTIKIFQTNIPGRDCTSFAIKSPASALALDSTQRSCLAVGSWNGQINLFDQRHLIEEPVERLNGHSGGVTLIKFLDDVYIVSGARKDNSLLMWDIRNSGKPVLNLTRMVDTNQRIHFDISGDGKWLTSGDTNGLLHVWDISNKTQAYGFKLQLHDDCCNGISVHPSLAILATSSGQHHIPEPLSFDSNTKRAENSLILWWCGQERNWEFALEKCELN